MDRDRPGYDEHATPSNMVNAEAALNRARIHPEMQVLDVAAGSVNVGIGMK